jgi:hypothetical protein
MVPAVITDPEAAEADGLWSNGLNLGTTVQLFSMRLPHKK